jgi:RNA polymerase sigma factor (sigma-70 family)
VDDRATQVATLMGRAGAGERSAYDALVGMFGGLVWHIARTWGLSPEDAADVSQTVWLRFVEQLERIREPERVGAWLATTTRRECQATSRRRARVVPVDLVDLERQGTSHLPGIEAVDASRLETTDRAAAVRLAFAQLPERCRDLLTLLFADPPLSYDEIAVTLDMRIGSIGPTRQRCLKGLKAHPEIARINDPARDSPLERSEQL